MIREEEELKLKQQLKEKDIHREEKYLKEDIEKKLNQEEDIEMREFLNLKVKKVKNMMIDMIMIEEDIDHIVK